MTAPQKLIGFAAALAVVFTLAFGLGAVWGPVATPDPHVPPAGEAAATPLPAGLAVTQNGYTLQLADSTVSSGKQIGLRFRITDDSGVPVTNYAESHQKLLHLIVVRRDLADYQHVHPALDSSGTWSVPLDLSSAGDYRVFADFVPEGGDGVTLGADLRVAGDYQPRPLPPAATAASVDGYTVTLAGSPKVGESSGLTVSVDRAGRPVTDLQPYLGAYGHLVALRAADLAYLHVHPMGEPGDADTAPGPDIGFHTSFPSAGDYRLFLDFKHGDAVRTAEFTVSVPVGHPGHEHGQEHDHQGGH